MRASTPVSSFAIVLVAPAGFGPAQALVPTAEVLCFGLRRLGHAARIRPNGFLHDATNIVVGAHLLDPSIAASLPPDSIVFNTEPVAARRADLDAIAPFARRFVVWDYSERNARALEEAVPGARVRIVEPGYTPEFTRLVHRDEAGKDVDALFYGAPSAYRSEVLAGVRRAGVGVAHLASTYGRARDGWLARAKLVLAVDFAPGTPFALGRVLYPMANRCAIVAVTPDASDVPADLRPGLVIASPDEAGTVCAALVRDAPRRRALGERALEVLARRDIGAALSRALAPFPHPG